MKNNSPVRIIINGAFGKMGRMAYETLTNDPRFNVIGKLGRDSNIAVFLQTHETDVILDLTQADCVFDNCNQYLIHSIPFVIGTSGLNPAQINEIDSACLSKKLSAVIVPNFSIGSVLATHFAKVAAKWFDAVDITEMHHQHKLDSPSGTAIHTAHAIHSVKSYWPNMNSEPQPGREHYVHDIPIHSIRMPGILAIQQTLFGQPGETLSIHHQIIDRQAYMPGLKLACQKVCELSHLQVGIESWLLQ